MYIFHGGCHGCESQEKHGVDYCAGCQYFQADWSLPSLREEKPDETELKRREIKERLGV